MWKYNQSTIAQRRFHANPTRASPANHANHTLLLNQIKFAFGSIVSEFLFLICIQKASSMKILLFCVINSSQHRKCFVQGFICLGCIFISLYGVLFVSKALTRSYLARSGFWHKQLVNKTPYAALSMTQTIYTASQWPGPSGGHSLYSVNFFLLFLVLGYWCQYPTSWTKFRDRLNTEALTNLWETRKQNYQLKYKVLKQLNL